MPKRKKLQPFVKILVAYGVLTLLVGLSLPILFRDDFQELILALGPLGPIAVITYTVVSHVFAPVTGAPAMIASLVLYGLNKTMFYEFIASIISAAIAYYIALHYGRRLIKKFVDPKSLEDIDAFVQKKGIKVLIITRIFGISIFDIISYASGLAKIPFKPYMLVTIITNALLRVVYILLLKDVDFNSYTGLATWFGILLLVGSILAFLIHRYLIKGMRRRKKE